MKTSPELASALLELAEDAIAEKDAEIARLRELLEEARQFVTVQSVEKKIGEALKR